MIRVTKQQAWKIREIYNAQTNGGKIQAIKYIKDELGCSLKEAKETVEDVMANKFRPMNSLRRTIDDDWEVSSERQYVSDALDAALETIDELLIGLREAASSDREPNIEAYEGMANQAKQFINDAKDQYEGE